MPSHVLVSAKRQNESIKEKQQRRQREGQAQASKRQNESEEEKQQRWLKDTQAKRQNEIVEEKQQRRQREGHTVDTRLSFPMACV